MFILVNSVAFDLVRSSQVLLCNLLGSLNIVKF